MSYSLNSWKGGIKGTIIGLIEDTRSLTTLCSCLGLWCFRVTVPP